MTPEKIVAVVEMYEHELSAMNIPQVRLDPSRTFASANVRELLAHAHYLCEGVKNLRMSRGRKERLVDTSHQFRCVSVLPDYIPSVI